MRYFVYGSTQNYVQRPTYTVQRIGRGGNKLGVLEKQVGFPNLGVLRDISYVQTKIKQGTWGAVPGGDPVAGKAAGLLCVSALGSGQSTTTLWYQIGVDSNGEAFAELGWRAGPSKGSMLKTYKHPITKDTVLKMVPKETISTTGTPKTDTVEFHFGSHVETLTWDQNSSDWINNSPPNFDWDDMNKIVSIHQQIEAYWGDSSASSPSSKIQLPGTRSNPFVFGPTEYKEKPKTNRITGKMEQASPETIPGDKFLRPEFGGNDPTFRYESDGNKVKLYSSKNR